jgi:hypothetical protein
VVHRDQQQIVLASQLYQVESHQRARGEVKCSSSSVYNEPHRIVYAAIEPRTPQIYLLEIDVAIFSDHLHWPAVTLSKDRPQWFVPAENFPQNQL